MHGGVAKDDLKGENVAAVESGFANLKRHIANVRKFGVPVLVTVNKFSSDTSAEMATLERLCKSEGVDCVVADNWGSGGEGAADLARAVVSTIDAQPSNFKPLYADELPLAEKVRTIAKELYGANDIAYDSSVKARFAELEKEGFGHLPVCIAKTQYSFSTDQNAKGAPSGFTIPIRELRLSAGAEFVVVVCGDIMTMPGLPKTPAANNIEVGGDGRISGLF
jgi:formate--tetrahydrofolate ligase